MREEGIELRIERAVELLLFRSRIGVVLGEAVQHVGVLLEVPDGVLHGLVVIGEVATRGIECLVRVGELSFRVVAIAPDIAGVEGAGDDQELRDRDREFQPGFHVLHTAVPDHPALI